MKFIRVFVDMLKKILILPFLFGLFFCVTYSQTLDSLRGTLYEVEIKTQYNPAIPIIKKAIQNRNENGQFSNAHFTYTAYQKMIFTHIDKDSAILRKSLQYIDSLKTDTVLASKKDSLYKKSNDFFEKQHLFFMETVTKNYFRKPATHYEKVIAHQTAGFKDPIVSIFLAKEQKVNFYQEDLLEILESKFVNPVSKTALTIYDFRIEEKIVQENDTLFVISFKPQKNAHFKSLKGKIWITSPNYAFYRIEAQPFDQVLGLTFELLQEYEKQPNNTWFLKDMFVKMSFLKQNLLLRINDIYSKPGLIAEKRITDIDYQTKVRSRDIGFVDIDEDLENEVAQKQILELYRSAPISNKEWNAITWVDSISKPFKLDRKLESLKIWITGKVPFRFLNFDVMNIFHFNSIETVRLGLGIATNNRLNKVVNFGGFFGYGFKDKTWKWGGEIGFNIIRTRDFKISIQGYSDLIESGGTDFFDRDYTLFSGEFYRSWLFKRMYRKEALGINIQSKLTRWLTGYFSSFYSNNRTFFDHGFQQLFSGGTGNYSFVDFYIKFGVRIAFKEKFWGAGNYYFNSVSPYPVFTVQYTRGIKSVGWFDYNKLDFKMLYRKDWKILGFTNVTIFAGYVDCPLPYPLLLNQRAGYNLIGMYGADQFGAMRADEFLSDRFAAVFIRHNFGRMTQNKKFSPRIIFCQGIGFGSLKYPEYHTGIDFKTMEKGYLESGLMVGDLLVIKGLLSFGVGAFVRYGAYYLPKPQYKTIHNFAFKLNVRVPFER